MTKKTQVLLDHIIPDIRGKREAINAKLTFSMEHLTAQEVENKLREMFSEGFTVRSIVHVEGRMFERTPYPADWAADYETFEPKTELPENWK